MKKSLLGMVLLVGAFQIGCAHLAVSEPMTKNGVKAQNQPTQYQRIVFFADTHYSDDQERNPGLTWTLNSNKNIIAALSLNPQQIHWLGDIMDFNISEYAKVKSILQIIENRLPDVDVWALMGNHEYIYYKYPEIINEDGSAFPDDLVEEVALTLSKPADSGQTTITVHEPVYNVVVGHKMLLMKQPETSWPYTFEILIVQSVDVQNNTITFTTNLTNGYPAMAYARQGWSNSRAIYYFRDAFKNTITYDSTTPTSTRYYYRTGNMLFIFLATDQYHPTSYPYAGDVSDVDLDWLEDVIASNYKTCNIIIQTHSQPAPGSEIGAMDNGQCLFSPVMQSRFKTLCKKYNVLLWIFAHVHANWRNNLPADVASVNGTNYTCIKPHLSDEANKPGIGTNWQAYWSTGVSVGKEWVAGRSYIVSGDIVKNKPGTWGNTCFVAMPTLAQMYYAHNTDEGQIISMDLIQGATSLQLNAYAVDAEGKLTPEPFRTEKVPLAYKINLASPR